MSSNRTLYIDVGPAKTGTSALQHLMKETPPAGLYYPRTGQWNDGAHHGLILAIDGKDKLNGQDLMPLDQQLVELEAEIALTSLDVLISSEAIRPKERLNVHIATLKPITDKYFTAIELIYTLRYPLDRAISGYNQAVKDAHVGLTDTPSTYLSKLPRVYLLSPMLEALAATGLKVHTVAFGEHKVTDLLTAIGHPLGAETEISRHINKSLGVEALLIHFLANNLLDSPEQRGRIAHEIIQRIKPQGSLGVPFSFGAKAVETYMQACVMPDNEAVTKAGMTYPHRLLSIGTDDTAADAAALEMIVEAVATRCDADADRIRALCHAFLSRG